MKDTIQDVLAEIAVPTALTTYVIASSAKWGAYFLEPGNIVSFITAMSTLIFAAVRVYYYLVKTAAVRRGKRDDE